MYGAKKALPVLNSPGMQLQQQLPDSFVGKAQLSEKGYQSNKFWPFHAARSREQVMKCRSKQGWQVLLCSNGLTRFVEQRCTLWKNASSKRCCTFQSSSHPYL